MATTRNWSGKFYSSQDDTLEGLSTNISTFASATLEKILREVALPKLQELIERDVYSYPNTWKGRTKEFERAWSVRRVAKGFFDTVEIFIDDGRITYNWDYQLNRYGHLASHSISRIEDLAGIINNGMDYRPPLGFPQMPPRPFWDDFLDWLQSGEFEKAFIDECSKYGVNMIVGGGSGITLRDEE